MSATLILTALSCGANENILKSGNETSIQTNSTTINEPATFANDLAAMQTAGFSFIYELRRRDEETIDSEDVRVIKQLTVDTNRRVKTDNDRAVLIGSNFELPKENLAGLNRRFLVEDHSQPPVEEAKTDANLNK